MQCGSASANMEVSLNTLTGPVVRQLARGGTVAASTFELLATALVLCLVYFVRHEDISSSLSPLFPKSYSTMRTLVDFWVITTGFILFVQITFNFLFRKTLFVAFLSFLMFGHTLVHPSERAISVDKIPPDADPDPTPPLDPIIAEFERNLNRSRLTLASAQRSPKALLFTGTVIAAIGLAFFLLTLPSLSSTPVQVPSPDSPMLAPIDTAPDFWKGLLSITPRLFMLLFIQLLAGFFLKQYRASMEEFRYYEAILRARENQFLSFLIRKNLGDSKPMNEIMKSLLTHKDFSILPTTAKNRVADAHKAEENDFRSLIDALVARTRATKDSKPAVT